MRFKADHNLPVELADLFRRAGYDAATAAEQGLAEAKDDVIAALCLSEERCIVTLDMGFSDIRTYPPADYPGIIVMRPRRQDKSRVLALGRAILSLLETETLENRLWIVEPDRVRVRGGEE